MLRITDKFSSEQVVRYSVTNNFLQNPRGTSNNVHWPAIVHVSLISRIFMWYDTCRLPTLRISACFHNESKRLWRKKRDIWTTTFADKEWSTFHSVNSRELEGIWNLSNFQACEWDRFHRVTSHAPLKRSAIILESYIKILLCKTHRISAFWVALKCVLYLRACIKFIMGQLKSAVITLPL